MYFIGVFTNRGRTSISSNSEVADKASLEAANRAASDAVLQWGSGQGLTVETLLSHAGSFFANVSMLSESNFTERAQLLGTRIAGNLEQGRELGSFLYKAD